MPPNFMFLLLWFDFGLGDTMGINPGPHHPTMPSNHLSATSSSTPTLVQFAHISSISLDVRWGGSLSSLRSRSAGCNLSRRHCFVVSRCYFFLGAGSITGWCWIPKWRRSGERARKWISIVTICQRAIQNEVQNRFYLFSLHVQTRWLFLQH